MSDKPNPVPADPGDLLHVPPDERLNTDPDPVKNLDHAALGDGGPDDVSDVDEGEPVDPAEYEES
jgi:hypothetical protein